MKFHEKWEEGFVAYDKERKLFIEVDFNDYLQNHEIGASEICNHLEKKFPELNQRNWFSAEFKEALDQFDQKFQELRSLAILEIFGELSYEEGEVFVQDTDAYGKLKFSHDRDSDGDTYATPIGKIEIQIVAILSEKKGRVSVRQPLYSYSSIEINAQYYFQVSDEEVFKTIKRNLFSSNMVFVNLTPVAIRLNNGTEYAPSGEVARVSASFSTFDENLVCRQEFGEINGLPEPTPGTIYIVSGMVLAALVGQNRSDVVAPATGHPDCIRNEQKQIVSVPGFVRN